MGVKKTFDKHIFEQLLARLCSEPEICGVFECSPHTLRRWVKDTYGQNYTAIAAIHKEKGKAELRRLGFKHAEKNPVVWIFMAKNYLGMSDNPASVDTGEKRKEFESAVKTASKALAGMDLSTMADIPPVKTNTTEETDGSEED